MDKARKSRREYTKHITAGSFAFRVVATILILQVLFPNVVHEPLHWVALSILDAGPQIVFDWSLPATPVVNFITSKIVHVWQAVFAFLLPAIVTFLLLAFIGSIRTRFPAIEIGATAYLAFDLVENIKGFRAPTSDFRLLLLTNHPDALAIFMIIIIIALALWGIFKDLKGVKIVKVINKKIQGDTYEERGKRNACCSRNKSCDTHSRTVCD